MLVALPVVSTMDSFALRLVGACIHPTLQVGGTHISLLPAGSALPWGCAQTQL